MFNLNTGVIKEKCACGMKAAENAVESVKDITVRPKLDAAFEVNSKKRQKNLFGMSLHFDKEFSLFKIILVGIGVIAGFAMFCTALDAMFGTAKKCKCKCKHESDADNG